MTDKDQSQLDEIIALEQRGYRSTAVQRLKAHLRANPDSAEAWYYLARFSQKPRDQFKAVQRALRLKPTYEQAWAFKTALLEEYPWLTPRFFSREVRVILIGLLLLVVLTGAAAVFLPGFLEEKEPEVVVVVSDTDVPTTAPDTPTPQIIIVTNTSTFEPALTNTPAPATFTATPNIPTQQPSALPSPTLTLMPATVSLSPGQHARTVLVAPLQNDTSDTAAQIAAELGSLYSSGDVQFEVAPRPVSSQSEAAEIASEQAAVMVIYGSRDGNQLSLNLYVQENAEEIKNRLDVMRLVRPSSPWQIAVEIAADAFSFDPVLQGVIDFITFRHTGVVDVLSPQFSDNTRTLTESEQHLALLLAYSYQVLGDHTNALTLYEWLNTYTGTPNFSVRMNRALAIAATGDPEAGIILYQSLLDQSSNPGFIQSNIAAIYAEYVGQPEAANLALDEAVALDPISARPYIERAWIFAAQENYASALAELDTGIQIDADFAPVYAARAILKQQLGSTEEAYNDITQAITLAPLAGDYYLLQGELLLDLRRWEEAAVALEQAVALGNRSPAIYVALGRSYIEQNEFDAAIQQVNQALSLDANYTEAWLVRGQAYMAQQQLTSALNDLNQGLQYDPENVALLVARCALHGRLGDDAAAATDCDSALLLDPFNGWALEQRGMIRYRAGDRGGAAQDFAEAIQYESAAYEAHYHLGLFALQENRLDAAIASLSTAINLEPLLGKAYAARGVAYRLNKQWQQALADLEQATVLVPDDPYNFFEIGMVKQNLADIAYEGGNTDQAKALYLEAQQAYQTYLDRTDPGVQFYARAQQGINYITQALSVIQGQ